MAKRHFLIGDPVPDFYCAASNNPRFHFDLCAGRYVIMTFFGTAAHETSAKVLRYITQEIRGQFDDSKLCFFGVSIDPVDRDQERVRQSLPGIRFFWDFDRQVSRLYGALDDQSDPDQTTNIDFTPFTLVLDPALRVVANISGHDADLHNKMLGQMLRSLPPLAEHAGVPLHAPVLVIPRVFEPEFCRKLIEIYDAHGGEESGSMTDRDGKTIAKLDRNFKRRKDCPIDDKDVQQGMKARIMRRIVPEIQKAFQYKVSHIERYIVACYDGGTGGFFKAHRDNTTLGTAHRRFACTINLNAQEYEGGDLRFPEFGPRTYRAPTGGAVVFSCSLLHEALPVTKGKRYATLPFFYDVEAAKIREKNMPFLSGEVIDLDKPVVTEVAE